ncbi:unnamed protein product [Staurois parvus]|uniref:Transposase Tc1-like domain-containing protein n=1 Tax=Staurois parvus TaxID=386267 RepID=A0ABN9BK32_9NEOB|nr:unnamed protein product [Staurois parvus]
MCEISLLLSIPQSTNSGIIAKWKQLGTTTTQPRSGRPSTMKERGQHMLKHTLHRNRQLSAESIAKNLQTSCGLQISTTVCRELHGMGFHGRAAASKPYITKCNAKHWMQWCKAGHHWTLEQWRHVLWSDESRFSVWQSNGHVWVWWLPGEGYLPDLIVPSLVEGGLWCGVVFQELGLAP